MLHCATCAYCIGTHHHHHHHHHRHLLVHKYLQNEDVHAKGAGVPARSLCKIYRSGYWIGPKSGAGLRDRAPFFMSKKRGGTKVGLYADAVKFLYIAGLCAGLRDHRIG